MRDLAKRTTKKMYTGRDHWDTSVDLSGDGSTLAIITSSGIGTVTEVRIVDVASGKTIAVRNDFSFLNGFSFSTDGKWASYSGQGATEPDPAYLWNIAKNTLTRISPADSDAEDAVISPDGKKFAYTLDYDTAYSVTLATGARQVINVNSHGGTTSNDLLAPIEYSADDNDVLFSSNSPDYGHPICQNTGCAYRRNLTTNQVTLASVLPNGTAVGTAQATMSQDGDVVSFLPSNSDGQVYTRRLSTSTTVLTSKNAAGKASNQWATAETINADGTSVAFVSPATNLGTPTPTGGLWLTPSGA
ncbi:MAG: PD40 domain-containing protein [Mycobacterium sp.]|nr:PD40 domain-containing protein [Mycobacterium sp.]